jgi:hypothetical protein
MWIVSGVDNDSYVLGPHTRDAQSDAERTYFEWRFTDADGGAHPATCPTCGRQTAPNFVSAEFRLARKRFDLSMTYDGYTVGSSRFRDACLEHHGTGLELDAIPTEAGFFFVRATRVLAVERSSPGLRFLYPCPRCHELAGVFGVSHLRLPDADPSAIGWWRTDLAFGQAHEQSPALVVGAPTAAWLRTRKLKGLSLNPVCV